MSLVAVGTKEVEYNPSQHRVTSPMMMLKAMYIADPTVLKSNIMLALDYDVSM